MPFNLFEYFSMEKSCEKLVSLWFVHAQDKDDV